MAGSATRRTVAGVSLRGLFGEDPAEPADPGVEGDSWVADDPFADAGLDASEDEEIAEFFAAADRLLAGNRAELSALSALSAQMGRYPVLEAVEQAHRVALVNEGLLAYAKLAAATGTMSPRERSKLERTCWAGEQAQTELIGSMFRLVLVISRELAAKRYGMGKDLVELPDLVSEANLALVEAVTTFDPSRGPAFSVYSARKVRERVRLILASDSPMKVPASWARLRRLATTLAPDLAAQLGRTPTVEEMQEGLRAQCMAWAADHLTESQAKQPEPVRIELMKAKLVKQGMLGAIDKYEEVMVATQQMWNLDAPVGGPDSGTSLGDLVADTSSDSTFDAVELSELRNTLMNALADLPDRDREIVLYRFGFIDGEVWTYAKLAPQYNISAERIRQIERGVLNKLRGPGFDALASFMPGV